jgi:hypothetical protein
MAAGSADAQELIAPVLMAAFWDRARLKGVWAAVLQTNADRRLIPPPAAANVGRIYRKLIGPARSGRLSAK